MKHLLPRRARRRSAEAEPSQSASDQSRLKPSRGRRTIDFLARLAFELLIIFVGVYAAFALSQHRAEREADEQRYQIREALIREIESVTVNTRRVATNTPRYLAMRDSLVAAGHRPMPQVFFEPFNIQTHMWDVTLQSNALDLLDVPTVYRLSVFYNSLNHGFDQLHQLRELSEEYLLPLLDEGPDGFYDDATGELRPSLAWYLPSVRRLGSLAERITVSGDSLAADLRRANAMGR